MDGVVGNSPVPYFCLAACAGPTFIVYGYLLSFAIDDIIQCHEWVGNWLNVTYVITRGHPTPPHCFLIELNLIEF